MILAIGGDETNNWEKKKSGILELGMEVLGKVYRDELFFFFVKIFEKIFNLGTITKARFF